MRRRIWRGLNMKTWKFNFRIIFPGWINCDAALATLLLVSALVHAVILWCFGMISNSHDESMRQKAYILAYLSRSYHPRRPWRVHFYDYKSDSATSLQKLQIFGCIWKPLSTWVCLHVLQVEVCVCFFSDAVDMYMDNSINLIWTPTLTPLQSWNTF